MRRLLRRCLRLVRPAGPTPDPAPSFIARPFGAVEWRCDAEPGVILATGRLSLEQIVCATAEETGADGIGRVRPR